MSKLIKSATIASTLVMLGACSILDFPSLTSADRMCARDDGEFYTCKDHLPQKLDEQHSENSYRAEMRPVNVDYQYLHEYTEQIAFELGRDLPVPLDKVIGVAPIGNEIAIAYPKLSSYLMNSLIDGMQQEGLPISEEVIEHSESSGFWSGNPAKDRGFGYLLSTSLLTNGHGIVFNVRVVEADNKRVVASSSRLIPYAKSEEMM